MDSGEQKLTVKKKSLIAEQLTEKTLRELSMGKYGNMRENMRKPVNSPLTRRQAVKLPFRIPIIERTIRQAQSLQGYKASAYWQTTSLLRDLIELYLEIIPSHQFRRKTQLEDAARSMVATIEEGWARPSTKEYLDYLGFAQASLTEVRGDVERLHTDGYLKVGKFFIPTPSRNFPYPPVNSRINPTKYGTIRERLREYTGRDIQAKDLPMKFLLNLSTKQIIL